MALFIYFFNNSDSDTVKKSTGVRTACHMDTYISYRI